MTYHPCPTCGKPTPDRWRSAKPRTFCSRQCRYPTPAQSTVTKHLLEVAEDVEDLLAGGVPVEAIPARLGYSIHSMDKLLRRAQRPDLACRFCAAARAVQQRSRRKVAA